MTSQSDSVKVAVRVRPFNQREKTSNSKCIISMDGQTTTIHNPSSGDVESFAYDKSYWSHDGFIEDSKGASLPDGPFSKYVDQNTLFKDLGQGVLDNAWEGYNSTVFAYGQTGAGKSYSMVGYGPNRGIIPITCNELFKVINHNQDKNMELQVTFSMLEIYNEQVKDLLQTSMNHPKGGLQVRQTVDSGFYVEGLKHVPVTKYKDIHRLIEQGTFNRTTAATNMNATSSRSHMVITITFKQFLSAVHHGSNAGCLIYQLSHPFFLKQLEIEIFVNDLGENTTKSSEINLVDLAGSEWAHPTGATGNRLKEGSAINQSLSSLGNVISALADIATVKKKVLVPYTDSVLTTLLQTALGGNSRTIMIAAISPAAMNYDETLSTLRYADRANKIQNKAVINENSTDRLVRQLKEENIRLQAALAQVYGAPHGTPTIQGSNSDNLIQQLTSNEKLMKEEMKTWEQKLDQAGKEMEIIQRSDSKEETQWKNSPFMQNVNEDPSLSGVIKLCLPLGQHIIGRQKEDRNDAGIEINGLGILTKHAVMSNTDHNAFIKPADSKAKLLVNGKVVIQNMKLEHLDRIVFGCNTLFLYIGFPSDRGNMSVSTLSKYDYNYFQSELLESAGIDYVRQNDNTADDREIDNVFEEYVELLPKIASINAISEEMLMNVGFESEMKNLTSYDSRGRNVQTEVVIRVTNIKTQKVWMWSKAKFLSRSYLIEEMYLKWLEENSVLDDIEDQNNPFWDPVEDIMLGSCHIWLQSLAHCIEIDDQMEMHNCNGQPVAMAVVKAAPSDFHGNPLTEDEAILDPSDLLGKRFDFVVNIIQFMGVKWIRKDNTRGIYCKYLFYNNPNPIQSKIMWHRTNPKMKFRKHFTVDEVTEDFLMYLQTHALVVELWGSQAKDNQKQAPISQSGSSEAMLERQVRELTERLSQQEEDYQLLNADAEKLRKDNSKLRWTIKWQMIQREKPSSSMDKNRSSSQYHNPTQPPPDSVNPANKWRNVMRTISAVNMFKEGTKCKHLSKSVNAMESEQIFDIKQKGDIKNGVKPVNIVEPVPVATQVENRQPQDSNRMPNLPSVANNTLSVRNSLETVDENQVAPPHTSRKPSCNTNVESTDNFSVLETSRDIITNNGRQSDRLQMSESITGSIATHSSDRKLRRRSVGNLQNIESTQVQEGHSGFRRRKLSLDSRFPVEPHAPYDEEQGKSLLTRRKLHSSTTSPSYNGSPFIYRKDTDCRTQELTAKSLTSGWCQSELNDSSTGNSCDPCGNQKSAIQEERYPLSPSASGQPETSQSTKKSPLGSSSSATEADVEMAKVLKGLFKDIKDVQRLIHNARQVGSSVNEYGAGVVQDDILAKIDGVLQDGVKKLKQITTKTIRRKKNEPQKE